MKWKLWLEPAQKLKLFYVLHIGCDPNLQDNNRVSPSDLAEKNNLVLEWEWALHHNGYVRDEITQKWVKFNFACEMLDALDVSL